jgi:serpin B
MKKLVALVMVVVTLFGTIACTSPATPTPTVPPVTADVLQSEKPRVTSPAASQADLVALADGNRAFAFDLYQTLKDTEGNLFFSPYSISLALAMTYGGARNNTETQMADALSFPLTPERLHAAFNAVDLALASRGEGAQGADGEGFRLNIANDIWGQQGYEFLPAYLDLLAQNYGAGLRVLDFAANPEQARVTINDQVSKDTEEKITELIPQGVIDELTRLVLTNAIYFNAAWQYPFEKTVTAPSDFFLLNGSKISVPMMRQQESFGYLKGDGYQVVELPYDGRELSMLILLPDQGQFDAFESQLSGQLLADIISGVQNKEVALSIPKFTYRSSFGLKEALVSLGMTDAFTPDVADFSGMDGTKNLYIQDVVHQAFVAVDEAGTEAAAATAVVVGVTSAPSEIITVDVNRPFVFVIRDLGTGTVLFVGRVVNPS